jgi:hypothetical protein
VSRDYEGDKKVEVAGCQEESGSPHTAVDVVVDFLQKYLLVS